MRKVIPASEVHRVIAAHPEEFMLGYEESEDAFGMTYDDDPMSDRSMAYDFGRSVGENVSKVTEGREEDR